MKKCMQAEFRETADRYAGVEGTVQDNRKKKKKLDIRWILDLTEGKIRTFMRDHDTGNGISTIRLCRDSTDNTYYLNHAADTSLSDSGAIYSEKEIAKDFDDYLTVLYGHNMKDGSMFAGLHKYEIRHS